MNDVEVINPVVADPCVLIKTSIHVPHIHVGDMSRREPGDSLPSPALSSLDQSSSIRFKATGTDEGGTSCHRHTFPRGHDTSILIYP